MGEHESEHQPRSYTEAEVAAAADDILFDYDEAGRMTRVLRQVGKVSLRIAGRTFQLNDQDGNEHHVEVLDVDDEGVTVQFSGDDEPSRIEDDYLVQARPFTKKRVAIGATATLSAAALFVWMKTRD